MRTSFSPAQTAPVAHSAAPRDYRGDLTLFMTIAFAVSWICWFTAVAIGGSSTSAPTAAPYMLGAFGPLIAAVVIRKRRVRRGEPVPRYAVKSQRRNLFWAPVLLVLASATVLSAAVLGHAAGDPALSLDTAKDAMKDMGGPAAFLVGMVVSGPLSEEPGWRGTAYPRMRASMNRFQVGLVLGVIWAVWHLPLFFIDGTPQNDLGLATPGGLLFAVCTIPMAMLTAYAYERAGVVASMAVHFSVNTTMVLLDVRTPATQALIIGIQLLVTVLLLATSRPSRPANKPAAYAAVQRDASATPVTSAAPVTPAAAPTAIAPQAAPRADGAPRA